MNRLTFDGKWLDTGPLKGKFTAGEKNVDVWEITGPRMYGNLDLSTLAWAMVGATEHDTITSDEMQFSVDGDRITLVWHVGEGMTAVHGKLALHLVGTRDGQTVLKIASAGTQVRDSLSGLMPPASNFSEETLNKILAAQGGAALDADRAETAAGKAEDALAHGPRVGEGGIWQTWDTAAGAYADTGVEAQGPKGDRGEVGPAGPQGEKGDTGAQGPQGIQGEAGPRGLKGDTGATGPQGPKGEKGDTGDVGPQGLKGDTGATGPQGPRGEKGDTGAVGPAGPQGETGPQGPQGIQGVQGKTGATGPQGPKGDTGETGPVGPQGPKGEKGDTGAVGPQGPKGDKGDTGADGTSFTVLGLLGTAADLPASGNPGDAWAVGTADSNTVYVWSASASAWQDLGPLKGPKGDAGAQGPQGPAGPKGDTGERGPQGVQGEAGPTGPQGLKGDKGDTGPAGPQGLKGDTGATGPAGPQGLQGEPGPQGPAGPKGDTGPAGKDGAQGPQGLKGDKGDTGAAGPVGKDGAQGPKGDAGAAGAPATINGVNALTLETAAPIQAAQAGAKLTLSAPDVLTVPGGGSLSLDAAFGAGPYEIQITPEEAGGDWQAAQVKYNNTVTGMAATDVQGAITELHGAVGDAVIAAAEAQSKAMEAKALGDSFYGFSDGQRNLPFSVFHYRGEEVQDNSIGMIFGWNVTARKQTFSMPFMVGRLQAQDTVEVSAYSTYGKKFPPGWYFLMDFEGNFVGNVDITQDEASLLFTIADRSSYPTSHVFALCMRPIT